MLKKDVKERATSDLEICNLYLLVHGHRSEIKTNHKTLLGLFNMQCKHAKVEQSGPLNGQPM